MWTVESDTESIIRELLGSQLAVPPSTLRIGAAQAQWWEGKPGDAVVIATGGSAEDRTIAEQALAAQLEGVGYKRAQFTFDSMEHTAGWPDIMAKAKRLIQSGAVTILRNGVNNIIGHVQGDHGDYDSEIGRDDPSSRTITTWQCTCPWDQYAWQRTRKWKKYEGRPCAHVMALYWKSLATPLDDGDPNQPTDPGQAGGPPPPPNSAPIPDTAQRSFGPDEAEGTSVPSPVETPTPMAPPGDPGVLPTPPMDQLQMQQPPIPGATPGGMPANPSVVSVPGAKVPTPFNPIQYPGGTYSSAPVEPPNYRDGTDEKNCAGCKMNDHGKCWGYGNKSIELSKVCDSWAPDRTSKTAAEEFVAPEIVRLKRDGYGMAEGKSEADGAGQYQSVPAGSSGEVLAQDPTTGWVEVIFPLDGGPMSPYHVRCYVDAADLMHTQSQPPGPFIKRRR